DGQPADRRRRLSRALWWTEGLILWTARAGPLCCGVLHHGQDRLHVAVERLLFDGSLRSRARCERTLLRDKKLYRYELWSAHFQQSCEAILRGNLRSNK